FTSIANRSPSGGPARCSKLETMCCIGGADWLDEDVEQDGPKQLQQGDVIAHVGA
ncbi:hypothetical protein NDU88_004156, partial [Pleurodeles waltl]